ncbi:MAG: hypothetical protein INH41_14800 [Myxococcaceae bacterium]|jgi:hypothetical protein|nr:hypothetical protein [Myxococcaceae bacterium]MCA3013648.1 hypothetical protein [Myxococcaceae bacterium]
MTPQPQPPAPAAPGWLSQHWKWVVGLGCALALLCCGGLGVLGLIGAVALPTVDEASSRGGDLEKARVDCGTPGPGGVDCEVRRTAGSRAISVCWDLEIACENGGVMTAQGCGALADGVSQATVNLPAEGFSNQEACDAPKRGAVKNLTVTLD